MNESTVLPSTFYPRPSTKTYTLFHTITSLWVEFSLSTLYFYDSSPTVFSRFGMDLAGNLDSCYLTRYPKTLMTFSGRNPFSFWLTSVSLTFVVVWYFVLRKKYIFPRIVMSVWCWPLLAIELEAKNPFESQLQDLLLQVPFPLYPETCSPSWIYIAYPRLRDSRVSREHENRREETGERKGPSFLLPPPAPSPPFRVPFTFASPPLSENRLEIREFFLFFRYSPATPLQTKASCYLMCSSWAEAALKCHAPSLSDEAFVNAWEPRGSVKQRQI